MILFLSNADTDLLAIRSVLEDLPVGLGPVRASNPSLAETPPSLDGVELVVVRLLGGRSAWKEPFDELRRNCLTNAIPLLALGGEIGIDAELTDLSTVPAGIVGKAFEYLANGGLANLQSLLRFLANTILMGGFGFDPPKVIPAAGIHRPMAINPLLPTVGIVFYRAHLLSGNTDFVDHLASAIERRLANALCIYCYSLRPDANGRSEAIEILNDHHVDAVITSVLAMGSTAHDQWDASALAALGVPIIQGITATSSRNSWEESSVGLGPVDVAMSVAIPELDGRIISVPYSFKEIVDDGDELGSPISAYRTIPDRVERVAGIATKLARLSRIEPADRKIAIVLSAYPTKRARLGNAVGLDTPASVIKVLEQLRDAHVAIDRIPSCGDELMAELASHLVYDKETLSGAAIESAPFRWATKDYCDLFAAFDDSLREGMQEHWGTAPGTAYVDNGEFVFPGIDLGNVLVAIQPPRGFGENPVAIYHSPDLPPTHQYVAFYRWLELVWNADVLIHVGKHGTLEWLPGKGVGLSGSCAPDAVLGDLPVIYPFVVNDPGEGTQAKRRAHAVIIDHLLPPMTRADTYDELAELETLLDEHARVTALDPDKLPAIRAQVWDLLVRAEIHRDLGIEQTPQGEALDELVVGVDGYLCELKDALIRGGLHILGESPKGVAEVDLVLAITRLDQGPVPSLRQGLSPDAARTEIDELEKTNRQMLLDMQANGWTYDGQHPTLRWICDSLIPALTSTTDELSNTVAAIAGQYVPSGPSGAPTRGMAHVLPTGRNFYSVDPRAVPSPLAWDVGCELANALVNRYKDEEGHPPKCVGIVVWGTAAMRTMGDDVAQVLALIGVKPVWQVESGRVIGLELISEADLGRERVDVTMRISGFFRDAFPHVVALLNDAFVLAGFDDDPRIFGPTPGAYGCGILALIESRDWRSDADLAEVYQAWSGYTYSKGSVGTKNRDAMQRRFAAIDVAVKNQDNKEHDIFDSDDYMQEHGGMIATVRSLTGIAPKAYFGDSSNPSRPKVRTLREEVARVVRSRVLNPKWIDAMRQHGYKGAFEMAATVDYMFGYDATAHVVEDWMYERVTSAYVGDEKVRQFFAASNPWALRAITERLLEANERGLWKASEQAMTTLRNALLESEGWEEADD